MPPFMRLTHYTRTIEAVANILTHGFAWVPNKRKLIQKFVPHHNFSGREPQQLFGMISFTDSEPPAPPKDLEEFGQFGIVVSSQWAQLHRAQRVLYVCEEGPVVDAFRGLFENGYEQLSK